jgi:hypothetical protein
MAVKGAGRDCPSCGALTGVIDSRPSPYGIRRRRKCSGCGGRITTFEVACPPDALARGELLRRILRLSTAGTRALRRVLDAIEELEARTAPAEVVDAAAGWCSVCFVEADDLALGLVEGRGVLACGPCRTRRAA